MEQSNKNYSIPKMDIRHYFHPQKENSDQSQYLNLDENQNQQDEQITSCQQFNHKCTKVIKASSQQEIDPIIGIVTEDIMNCKEQKILSQLVKNQNKCLIIDPKKMIISDKIQNLNQTYNKGSLKKLFIESSNCSLQKNLLIKKQGIFKQRC